MALLTDSEKLVHKQEHSLVDRDKSEHALFSQSIYNLEKVMQILSLLSKSDAMTIFLASLHGLDSRQETHVQLGLTKKQYYTRLKQLVDLSLIEKQDRGKKKVKSYHTPLYMPTLFGSMVYKRCVLGLEDIIKNSKKLEAVEILKQSSRFSADEIVEFLSCCSTK
ncbi:MAG: hypothetical protein ACYC6W_02695 [Nitrosotalea sp.]